MPVIRAGTVAAVIALSAPTASAQTPRLHESVVVLGRSDLSR